MRTVVPYRSSEAAVRSWSTRAAQRLLADAHRVVPSDPDRARELVRRAGTLAPELSGLPAARAAVGLPAVGAHAVRHHQGAGEVPRGGAHAARGRARSRGAGGRPPAHGRRGPRAASAGGGGTAIASSRRRAACGVAVASRPPGAPTAPAPARAASGASRTRPTPRARHARQVAAVQAVADQRRREGGDRGWARAARRPAPARRRASPPAAAGASRPAGPAGPPSSRPSPRCGAAARRADPARTPGGGGGVNPVRSHRRAPGATAPSASMSVASVNRSCERRVPAESRLHHVELVRLPGVVLVGEQHDVAALRGRRARSRLPGRPAALRRG